MQFLLVARFDQNRLKLVGLSPTGQKLLVLDYDGEELTQETSLWVDVPGKEILAVIQFALWPGQSINNWYPEKEGWQVDISPEIRILLTVAGVLLNISYEGEKIIIDNYLHEYRVLVHMLEKTEL